MIDAALVRDLLNYNPDTGVFLWNWRARSHFARDNQWRNWNGRYPGAIAGRVGEKGYRAIAVLGKLFPAHRLAWLHVHGTWPTGQIDHINGERDDNSIANLRDVSGAENAKNRRLRGHSGTGRIGVTRYDFHGRPRFVARLRTGGRLHHLGYFDTIEGAANARANAEAEFGFRTNLGSGPKSRTPLKSRNTFTRRGA